MTLVAVIVGFLAGVPTLAGAAAAQEVISWKVRAAAAFEKLPLAPTPPMGWNSWNRFGCDINEDLIRETADAMVASGMRDAGYEYVNIDDCWMAPERDANGRLQADPERFPSGIKALADYVHARGLKLGIYSSAGTATCQGLPASLGHEEVDAQSFADWGVDLLKYDNCNNQGIPAIERYTVMAEALAATGRPIVYSICEWGSNQPWLWAGEIGHFWRTTGDIADRWDSVVSILDQQVGLEAYSGPNAWNDPDMLEVGNGGMTTVEYRSHMSLWALLNAPLLAGNDLRNMSATTLELLTNPEVIAINQDWAGIQGHKIADSGDLEVWAKPLSNGGAAVVLFNRGPAGAQVATTARDLGLPSAPAYTLRDVWSHTTTTTRTHVRASVPSHGSRMFVVTPGVPSDPEPALSVAVRVEPDQFVQAGQPFTAYVALTNDGLRAVKDVELQLSVPDGWSVRANGSTTADDLGPGRTFEAPFTVTAPAGTTDGTYELAARASYRTVGKDAADRELDGFGSAIVATTPRGTQWLSDLDPLTVEVGWGSMGIDESVDGNPMRIAGVTYEKGIAPHAPSKVTYYLGRNCTRFTADVGIDDETNDRGSVTFHVLGDDKELAATDVITGGQPAQHLDVDVSDVQVLSLVVDIGPDNNNYDHSEWAAARITCAGPTTSVTATASADEIPAGSSVEVSGRVVVEGTEALVDLTFAPETPAGWSMEGDAVVAARAEPGDVLEGSWKLTAPADGADGTFEIPVVASYHAVSGDPGDPPLTDRAVVRISVLPAGWLLAREAEAPDNTLSGATRIADCGNCSGGQKVGYIGNGPDNQVTFNEVTVDAAGDYELVVDYLVDGTRSFYVSVNGGEPVEVSLSGSSWSTPVRTTIPVTLQAGGNTIRFGNDTAYAPDLDRIAVVRSGS